MPIPSSGALTLSAIQTEFGGANPISLSEYYAGGANVPAGTSGVNGAVPSSGAISMSRFYGTSDTPPVNITNQAPVSVLPSGTATAQYMLAAGGALQITTGTNSLDNVPGEWLVSGSATAYEARATFVSSSGGTPGGDAEGVWLSLGTVNRSWTLSQSGAGAVDRVLTIDIRRVSDGVVVDTATVTLMAEIAFV